MKNNQIAMAFTLLACVVGCGDAHSMSPNGKYPPTGNTGLNANTTSNADPAQNGLIHSGSVEAAPGSSNGK